MHRSKVRRTVIKRPSLIAASAPLFAVALIALAMSPAVNAQARVSDADLSDWCLGAASNSFQAGGRTEDSYIELNCNTCSVTTDQACEIDSDCPGGETCTGPARTEMVFWDNRTDGAVNDLATFAITSDNNALYLLAELWVDPDPVSLPFGEVAIDFRPGGISTWYDPDGVLATPGNCSVSTDRACTSDADCHFCAISTEPAPSTRIRACGSGCNPDIPGDVCDMTQTCLNQGAAGSAAGVGGGSSPTVVPDVLVLFDFSRWLVGLPDAVQVREDVGGSWVPIGQVFPAVNPGASGGSGGPPGAVETTIPWDQFGCTGCPAACSCPGFGPGQDFQFTLMIARGTTDFDYDPDGAIEDVFTEAVAGTTTVTGDSCPGMGIGTTDCELTDGTTDGFVPPAAASPGGIVDGLLVSKGAGDEVTLNWNASCAALDNDYGVYEGDIGNYYSHTAVGGLCTTAGATSATFTSTGSKYYLVVPADASNEGGYGRDSSGSQRPVGVSVCATQALGPCS